MSGAEQLLTMNSQPEFKLFVGDLDENCNEKILLQNFSKYGTLKAVVQKAKKKRYASENQDRYYGVLFFDKAEKMELAKQEMDHQVILNNRIRVCVFRGYFDRVNSDVYLKGVGSLSSLQIKEAFSQFGPVFSVKVPQLKNGQTLNYGYLSFTDKEAKEKCLSELSGKTLPVQGHSVEVSNFVPFNKRERNQTNIYLKNLPGKTEDQDVSSIEEALRKEAQKYGTVSSMMVKYDDRHQKHFAFVCYSDSEDAKKAYSQMEHLEIMQHKVEINWAMKKEDRNQVNLTRQIKKTNIFMKNLLETVDEAQLRQAFEKFGAIKSVAVKMPTKVPTHVTQKTQMGFVNFQSESSAHDALNALKDPSSDLVLIKSLFLESNPVICLHRTKDQMSSNSKQNQQNIMQMMQQMAMNPQMFMQTMQQMMMMNMGMMMKGGNQRNQRNLNMMGKQNMPMMGMPMMGAGRQMPVMPNMGMPQMGMPTMAMPQMMPTMGMNQMTNVQSKQNHSVPSQVTPSKLTPSSLKENLNEFLKQDQEKQRSILGELLFPAVERFSDSKEAVPKITGMLIDFDVFEVTEILEFLENDELLKERIQEAHELIESTTK